MAQIITSCRVTAIAAAILLQRQTQATAIDNNVFSGYNGVKPKKIPIADPSAMECGVSAIAIKVMWCATSQRFIRASGLGNRDS